MPNLNRVQLSGHLGKDPELRYTASGHPVAHFSMATSYGEETAKKTEWHNVVVWDDLAEAVCAVLHKGSGVYLEGRSQTRKYEKDGIERTITEIVASYVYTPIYGKKKVNQTAPGTQQQQVQEPLVVGEQQLAQPNTDDLPF